MKYVAYPISKFSIEAIQQAGDILSATQDLKGLDIDSIRQSFGQVMRPLVDQFPSSEAGAIANATKNSLGYHIKLPSADAVTTEFPFNSVGSVEKGINNLVNAHTHPTVMSGDAIATIGRDNLPKATELRDKTWNPILRRMRSQGVNELQMMTEAAGKNTDMMNMPKYPSAQDYLANAGIRTSTELGRTGTYLPDDLVFTKEYGKPVDYKYRTNLDVLKNPIRALDAAQDFFRAAAMDKRMYLNVGDSEIAKQAFLERAAQQEYLSHVKNPYIQVERIGEAIPDALPKYNPSRLGEVTAGVGGASGAIGGIGLANKLHKARQAKQTGKEVTKQFSYISKVTNF